MPSRTRAGAFVAVICIAVAAAGTMGACARTVLPTATAADAAVAAERWPGTTADQLNAGRGPYLSRCAGCHQPVRPDAIAPVDWPRQIAAMRARAKLSDPEADLVERYLVVSAETRHRPPRAAAR